MKFFGEDENYSSKKSPEEFFGVIRDLVARVKEADN
jgi:hypothetical protein